jgi:hypothetical protein
MAAINVYPGIVVDPDILHGQPTIRGTHIPSPFSTWATCWRSLLVISSKKEPVACPTQATLPANRRTTKTR